MSKRPFFIKGDIWELVFIVKILHDKIPDLELSSGIVKETAPVLSEMIFLSGFLRYFSCNDFGLT